MKIVRRLKDRYGFQVRSNRVLGRLLSLFFRCRCDIPAHIAALEEPVVFVSNHYEIFGPLAMVTSLPLKYRMWSNSIIIDPVPHVERMIPGTRRALPVLTEGGARRLLRWLTPVWGRAVKHFEPIPVYREDMGLQRRSIRQTVDFMQAGDSILLFPETGIPTYSDGSVTAFFPSFALIGEYYFRQTGRRAAFCPVYIDKWRRRISFGTVVRYGGESAAEECRRIPRELRGQILAMAEAAHPGITRKDAEI